EGTSFQTKIDTVPVFVLKFAAVEFLAAAFIAAAEWMYVTRRFTVTVAWQEYRDSGVGKFVRKVLFPCGIYLIAAMVILLNISLMFDNVLWGDECFSANTAQKDVDGILQVMYFWDNHPPLHYYWLKLFGEIFGHTGSVYHLASLTPFVIGIVLALVFLRRHFGSIPAAFFIIITGVASSCLQYNLEIRMYSLAFLGVVCCYYCAYRVLSGGRLAWFGMVFWALVGAYSHYYAMMTVGILIFITGVAAAVRYGGKTWIKGLLALLAFIAGYAPWLGYLFHATNNVSNNWWMSEIMGLGDSLQMLLCGPEFQKIVLCLLIVFIAVLFLTESSFFRIAKDKKNCMQLSIHKPSLKNWSDEAYGAAVGILTVAGTLIAAYVLCLIVGPVLIQRYLYPVSAVTILLLVISGSGCMALVKKWGEKFHKTWPKKLAKTVLVAVLAVLLVIGLNNYRTYSSQVRAEKAVTEQALSLIGEVPEDTVLVSNNVKHLAWTVLYYYYPDREIITSSCSDNAAEYDKFWYFTPEPVGKGELQEMYGMGFTMEAYGAQQIAAYPFELYYFERD
ncbi:MAG: glycosyltransferase family 39 protein, partial [Acetatifactor sp.]|nr:glycosyltransferase family 39 protein [Acetatifactor sp.]